MIILDNLKWSYAFSYGPDNEISFTDSKLLQILGDNGNGKSSISIILEEVIYNKNSKGFLKGDILNRNTDSKFYTAELTFTKNEDKYTIYTKRGSTQSVKLTKNGEDISSHTSTSTYKTIEAIMGIDHKTFCQIVCQSHSSSLEFLTSPDTARKKFLIELLNLSKYTEIGEVFKRLHSEINKSLIELKSKISTIGQWVEKNNSIDDTKVELKPVLEIDKTLIEKQVSIKSSLSSIESTNEKIIKNNTYKSSKDRIDLKPIGPKIVDISSTLAAERAEYNKTAKDAQLFINKLSSLDGECPTCFQNINKDIVDKLTEEHTIILNDSNGASSSISKQLTKLQADISEWNKIKTAHNDWEKYHQLVDESLPESTLDANELESELSAVNKYIRKMYSDIEKINEHNTKASVINNKIDLIKTQTKEMLKELDVHNSTLVAIEDKAFTLSTLAKAFSTTGLVAYKIENLSKDLENLSNNYLSDMSDGRFQISFQMSDSDKLNVIITDYGADVKMTALSTGERNRVNIAVLLAIRTLMQGISDARINLLFLDETISTLDPKGKEKLIEVLLEEENLNTILVSHEFSHPLLDKIIVEKDNKISKLIKE